MKAFLCMLVWFGLIPVASFAEKPTEEYSPQCIESQIAQKIGASQVQIAELHYWSFGPRVESTAETLENIIFFVPRLLSTDPDFPPLGSDDYYSIVLKVVKSKGQIFASCLLQSSSYSLTLKECEYYADAKGKTKMLAYELKSFFSSSIIPVEWELNKFSLNSCTASK